MSAERIKFLPGEFFVYVNGSSWELGKVKRAADEEGTAYFCWYSLGTTAARTPVENMHKLRNHDGGPANQLTLDKFVTIFWDDDTRIKVLHYFSERVLFDGVCKDLPPDLAYLPVEEWDDAGNEVLVWP